MSKLAVGLAGFVTILGVGAFFLQRETNAEIRSEIALLRADVQEMAKQQAVAAKAPRASENAAVAVIAPENSRADQDRAELAKLRDDVATLKQGTQELARQAQAAVQAARGESPVPVKLIPAGEWKNAGRATPSAAVETVLWAAAGGDVDTLTGMITLDAGARAKAEALYAQLPDASRADYGSPDKLVALFLAKDASVISGMQILGQRDVTADIVGVRVRLANEQGQTKEDGFGFQKSPDGLRLVVTDKIVDKYAQQLAGGTARPSGGK